MIYKEMDTNYLLTLIKAALNNDKHTATGAGHDWIFLYKFSEFHKVSVMVYYAILGKYAGVTRESKHRFSASFHKGVSSSRRQLSDLSEIGGILNRAGISMLLLPPTGVSCMYPQADMRELDEIYICFLRRDEDNLIKTLKEAGFFLDKKEEDGSLVLISRRNVRFVFLHNLFPHFRRLHRYFSRIWAISSQDRAVPRLHYLSPEDQYILLLSWISNKFVFEKTDIRDVTDVHMYLRHYKDKLNWTYIEPKLKKLRLLEFAKAIEQLGWLWLGSKKEEPEEGGTHEYLIEYIFSKGMYGHEECAEILPMIHERKVLELRQQRKAQLNKMISWLFPDSSYMRGIYSALKELPFLLPACWLLRLLHLLCYNIKSRIKKRYLRKENCLSAEAPNYKEP